MQVQKIDYSDTRRGMMFDPTSGAMLLVGSESTYLAGHDLRIGRSTIQVRGVFTLLDCMT